MDAGKWYEVALNRSTANTDTATSSGTNSTLTTLIPIVPITGWQSFPSTKIPAMFNAGHVYHYLYEQCSELAGTRDDNTTVKPMQRGALYVDSNHVTEVMDQASVACYFIKSKIFASFKLLESYSCTVTLSQNSSSILECTCDCKQSSLGRCSHIAGFLQFLLDHIEEYGYDSVTCTGKLCYWASQGTRKRNPQKVRKYLQLSIIIL